jgi:hypothetical protein
MSLPPPVLIVERVPDVMLIHAKVHPVLGDAPSWKVEGLHLSLSHHESAVVVRLARGEESIELRFDGVDDFTVAGNFPEAGSRLRILDVSHLLWQGVSIRVESVGPGLGFWAGAVTIPRPAARRLRATKPRVRPIRSKQS